MGWKSLKDWNVAKQYKNTTNIEGCCWPSRSSTRLQCLISGPENSKPRKTINGASSFRLSKERVARRIIALLSDAAKSRISRRISLPERRFTSFSSTHLTEDWRWRFRFPKRIRRFRRNSRVKTIFPKRFWMAGDNTFRTNRQLTISNFASRGWPRKWRVKKKYYLFRLSPSVSRRGKLFEGKNSLRP